jgi:hypothetical protein
MEDRVRLTADASDYERVMRRAGNTADQFTNRISAAHKGFTGMFKRTPDMRAERAMSGFVERIAQGDIAGGIAQISSRMTGLGLVAGVAVIAGVEVFKKFKEQIDATREAHAALEMEMIKRPLSNVANLSASGMQQALQTTEKLTAELSKKSEGSQLGSTIWEGLKSAVASPFVGIDASKIGKERLDDQKELNEAHVRAKKIMEDEAKLAAEMVSYKRLELMGDEAGARIGKINLDRVQASAALHDRNLPAAINRIHEDAITDTAEAEIAHVKLVVKLKEGQLAMEEKIAALQHKGLMGEDLKKVKAGLEIQLLDQEIAGTTSPLAKRTLQLQRLQKVNEAHGLYTPTAPSNPFPFGTAAGRDFDREAGFGKRNIEESLGFGGLARGSMERGESLTPEEALLKTKSASTEEIAGYKKGGALPGGPQQAEQIRSELVAIKNIIDQAWAK